MSFYDSSPLDDDRAEIADLKRQVEAQAAQAAKHDQELQELRRQVQTQGGGSQRMEEDPRSAELRRRHEAGRPKMMAAQTEEQFWAAAAEAGIVNQ